jgi:hypothetical protein
MRSRARERAVAEVYGLGHTLKTMQDWLEKAKVVV